MLNRLDELMKNGWSWHGGGSSVGGSIVFATDEEILEAMAEIPGMPFLRTNTGAFMCSANNTILLI